MFDITSTPILCFAIAAGIYIWIRSHPRYVMGIKLPGPPSMPIFGNIFELKLKEELLVPLMFKYSAQFGGFFRVWVFHNPLVVISTPEHFQTLYTSSSSGFKSPGHYNLLSELMGEKGLFVSNGETWRRSRKLLVSTFNQNPMHHADTFAFAKKNLMTELSKRANGETFQCSKILRYFSMYLTWANTFGELDKEMSENIHDKLYHIEKALRVRSTYDIFRIPFILKLFKFGRKYYDDLGYVHNTLAQKLSKKIVEYKELKENNQPVPKYFFYKQMEKFPNETAKDLVGDYSTLWETAAITTPVSIGYFLIVMGLFPEIQEKVLIEYHEIKNKLGREPGYEDLRMFQYLDRVIKESMRIFPMCSCVFRLLKTDLQFGEYLVREGTIVGAFNLYLCHNPDVYPDPLKFDPDRFLPENVEKRHPYAYIPFLVGPRICPGKTYAMAMMKLILPTILNEFKVLPHYQSTEEVLKNVQFDVIMNDSQSTPIKLVPRN